MQTVCGGSLAWSWLPGPHCGAARRSCFRNPKRRLLLALLLFLVACRSGSASAGRSGAQLADTPSAGARWAASDDLRVTVHELDGSTRWLTSGSWDFKPSWSRSGSMLTFFRLLEAGSDPLEFALWKTKLCVIGADGAGFRELTGGKHADFNPTWTRDGTNRVIFNRFAARGPGTNDIYLQKPDGAPGDEVRVSDPAHPLEWAFSGLRDGRIFIDRIDPRTMTVRSFLLTPRPGAAGSYQEIVRPSPQLWHKLSVSPDETKVAYMLDNDGNLSTFNDAVLHWASFDARKGVVSNPVAITRYDPKCVNEYPRWSADSSTVIYDSNCSGAYQMRSYRLPDRTTTRISPDTAVNVQFGTFEGVPQ